MIFHTIGKKQEVVAPSDGGRREYNTTDNSVWIYTKTDDDMRHISHHFRVFYRFTELWILNFKILNFTDFYVKSQWNSKFSLYFEFHWILTLVSKVSEIQNADLCEKEKNKMMWNIFHIWWHHHQTKPNRNYSLRTLYDFWYYTHQTISKAEIEHFHWILNFTDFWYYIHQTLSKAEITLWTHDLDTLGFFFLLYFSKYEYLHKAVSRVNDCGQVLLDWPFYGASQRMCIW